jgi:hypothetical protein
MKTIVKITLILFLIPSFLFANKFSGKHTKTKTLMEEFNISADGLVHIHNKYGSIDIKSWDQNKVSIEVIITTNGNSESNVQDGLDRIDVQFESSNNEVSARTRIEKKNNWSWFGNSNNVNMDIKYIVRMPVSNNLDVSMDYGDVMIDKLEGSANIDIDYGKLIAGELLNAHNDINMDYSTASSIDVLTNGIINIDYSTIEVGESKNIDLNSDYSNTTFINVENLTFDCDYGNLIVDNAEKIIGDSDYLDLKIGKITDTFKITADYGNLKIRELDMNFNLIDLETEYMGVKIGVDKNCSFSLIADMQYGSLQVPDNFNMTKQIEKNSKKHYEGTYNGTGGKININSQYGSVKIYKN